MAFLKVKNRAFSTLASGVDDTTTSWTVATGEGALFPTTGDFHVTCEDEIVKCTSRSGDVLTVVREQEGTTKAAHSAGKAVELRVTAGVIENIQSEHNTHKDGVLSTTVHNNNNYFLGYGNEAVTDPTQNALVKIPTLTAIEDPASGLDVSDWYGESGAYRQADADSDATHIRDDDANFPDSIQHTLVKWASNSGGTENTGIGYIATVTGATELVIEKFTGADFAASYYYWIKHSEWVVPVTGIYHVTAAVVFLPAEANERFQVRVFRFRGTSAPVQLLQGIQCTTKADMSMPSKPGFVSLQAGDHLYHVAQHSGTSGVPDIWKNNETHLPLQAFLEKKTA